MSLASLSDSVASLVQSLNSSSNDVNPGPISYASPIPIPENVVRYVPQGSSLVPSVSIIREPLHTGTLTALTDCLITQDSIRYTLQDSYLVPVSSADTNHISSTEILPTISNIVSHNVHPMQTISKTRSVSALTTSLQPQDDLVHYVHSVIYSAMQSPHWAHVAKE